MTTKNEETLLGIEKCSELLLDKPIFFSLICHNSIFFELWSQLSINPISERITLYSESLRFFLKKIHIFTSINNYGNNF